MLPGAAPSSHPKDENLTLSGVASPGESMR
jgi:hypothetical protein